MSSKTHILLLFAAVGSMGLDPHDDDRGVVLETVDPSDWEPAFASPGPERYDNGTSKYPYLASATRFKAAVFDSDAPGKSIMGRFWLGSQAQARLASPKTACNGGQGLWYELSTGGFVCDSYGFSVSKHGASTAPALFPNVAAPLPFSYARVIEKGALRLNRLPREDEVAMLDQRAWPPEGPPDDLVEEEMFGDFFLALDEIVELRGRKYYRTVHGQFVRADALDVKPTPPMRGESLEDAHLPLAFVYGEGEHTLFCRKDGALDECGVAEKHARFSPDGMVRIDGTRYVKGPEATLIPRDEVRLVEETQRPEEIGQTEKWIHFDLSEQTLVAYEGETPVYASLISSGKPGRDTPSGLYRIKRKYLTKTMRGKDDVEGIYHVEDVPWTMYYYGSYAVHGAYWHNVFGNTRSHGCTNLAPADARWVYNWTDPKMPDGWHALTKTKGTWFYFTN